MPSFCGYRLKIIPVTLKWYWYQWSTSLDTWNTIDRRQKLLALWTWCTCSLWSFSIVDEVLYHVTHNFSRNNPSSFCACIFIRHVVSSYFFSWHLGKYTVLNHNRLHVAASCSSSGEPVSDFLWAKHSSHFFCRSQHRLNIQTSHTFTKLMWKTNWFTQSIMLTCANLSYYPFCVNRIRKQIMLSYLAPQVAYLLLI